MTRTPSDTPMTRIPRPHPKLEVSVHGWFPDKDAPPGSDLLRFRAGEDTTTGAVFEKYGEPVAEALVYFAGNWPHEASVVSAWLFLFEGDYVVLIDFSGFGSILYITYSLADIEVRDAETYFVLRELVRKAGHVFVSAEEWGAIDKDIERSEAQRREVMKKRKSLEEKSRAERAARALAPKGARA